MGFFPLYNESDCCSEKLIFAPNNFVNNAPKLSALASVPKMKVFTRRQRTGTVMRIPAISSHAKPHSCNYWNAFFYLIQFNRF